MDEHMNENMKAKLQKLKKYLTSKDFVSNLLFILFLVFLRLTVLGNYTVPTGSMNPTILEGDKFFANKLAYGFGIKFGVSNWIVKHEFINWGSPKRGDIIAFMYPENENIDYTKRVVGIAGDTIMVKDKRLYLNGKELSLRPLKEKDFKKYKVENLEDHLFFEENLDGVKHVVQHSMGFSDLENFPEVTIPEGYVFAMGDNRDNSQDSRVWGLLPVKNVTGKLVLRWYSNEPGNIFKARLSRIGFIK